jgi:hypothetical protein
LPKPRHDKLKEKAATMVNDIRQQNATELAQRRQQGKQEKMTTRRMAQSSSQQRSSAAAVNNNHNHHQQPPARASRAAMTDRGRASQQPGCEKWSDKKPLK